jgi:ATP:ADP antiporter, AAA family
MDNGRQTQPASSWLSSALRVGPDERTALVWSFAYFFLLLAAYYVLRPVRTEMAVQTGVKHLPWLFTATFLISLAIQPLFGWLTARFPRAHLLPAIYAFFALNLLVFYVVFGVDAQQPLVAQTFFIWLSVFNLFVVSVFWSFMADVFRPGQGKRLFAVISAGGSLGAIAGAAIPAFGAQSLGIDNMILVSAALLSACIVCIARLRHWAALHVSASSTAASQDEALGGGVLSGITAALSTPFLGGISAYVLLWTYSSIVLDLEIARIFAATVSSPLERTALAGRVELTVSIVSLAAQLFITTRLVERFGVASALVALPVINIVGFLTLAWAPSLMALMIFDVARRAGDYAIAKPGREMLFTVVDREAKYKAKNFIDTALTRGGTVASGWAVNGIKALGASGTVLAFTVVPVAFAWAVVGWLLARQHTIKSAPEQQRQ